MNNAPNIQGQGVLEPEPVFGFIPTPGPEMDLVAAVKEMLEHHGLHAKVPLFLGHRWIIDAQGIDMRGQRFLLNRYWGTVLMSIAPISSIDERMCLVHDGQGDDWIRLFKTKVLPFCMEYDLPRGA